MVWSADYEAFGSVLNERGESNFTPSYTGKFFDKSSGLYYFNARWYDSELGRFTTQDPIRDGMNWYAYCNNSSLIFVDSNGCVPRKPTPLMGTQAHLAIQNNLRIHDAKNGVQGDSQFYLRNPSGEKKGAYYVDYQRMDSNGNKEFYEIKPSSYMKNKKGDRQLEKYIERDGEAIKGTELLSEIPQMGSIKTMMKTPLGIEEIEISLKVDPENHPGMIFYDLDDGRTPEEYKLKVAETILKPVVTAAMIVIGAGSGSEIPPLPTPAPIPVP